MSGAGTDTVGAGIICYVGVQGWLVRSGVVSTRWFHQNSGPNGKKGCDLLFGSGVLIWDKAIADADHGELRTLCRTVQAGHIVHIWSPSNNNWNGHWVVANGDGTICGVNNGEFTADTADNGLAVQKDYTKTSTLFEQFVGYSNEWNDESSGTRVRKRTRACMAVIDPMPSLDLLAMEAGRASRRHPIRAVAHSILCEPGHPLVDSASLAACASLDSARAAAVTAALHAASTCLSRATLQSRSPSARQTSTN